MAISLHLFPKFNYKSFHGDFIFSHNISKHYNFHYCSTVITKAMWHREIFILQCYFFKKEFKIVWLSKLFGK